VIVIVYRNCSRLDIQLCSFGSEVLDCSRLIQILTSFDKDPSILDFANFAKTAAKQVTEWLPSS
jgi:hypothetical protein